MAIDRRVADLHGDIEYLCAELAQYGVMHEITLRPLSRRGRPKNGHALEEELDCLCDVRAWLHSQLVVARGEEVFARGSGAGRLAAAGIIAPPQAPTTPTPRGRGRPKGHGKGVRFAALVDWLQEGFTSAGRPITKKRAIELATSIKQEFRALSNPAAETGRRQAQELAGESDSDRANRRYYETRSRRAR